MKTNSRRLRTISDSVATCSLLLTLAVLIGIGILSYGSTQRFLQNDQRLAHTHQVVGGLDAVLSDLKDAETGQRGYLLTGDVSYLLPYQRGSAAAQNDILRVRVLIHDDAAQQRRLDLLQSISAAKLAELEQTIQLRRNVGMAAALKVVEVGRGKRLMDQARIFIGRMQSVEQTALTERTEEAEEAGSVARLWNVLGTLLAVLLIVNAIGFVANYLRQRRRAEADNLRLVETARDAALQQRVFLKDVLASVTEGRLALCDVEDELPPLLPEAGETILLTRAGGSRDLRQAALSAARVCGFPEERAQDLATSVSEAAMNAITHGGGGEAVVRTDNGDKVQVRIVDRGKGITLDALPQSTLERGYSSAGSLGHGFWLMLRMCDRVSLLTGPQGTTVVLEQDRVAREAPWMSRTTELPPLGFKTMSEAEGQSGSTPEITNRSFRTRSL